MEGGNGMPGTVGGVSNPQAQVVLQIQLTLTADGRLQVGAGPSSPRAPTLEDAFALACRMKRDVEMQMLVSMMTAAQARAIQGLMERSAGEKLP